MKAIKRRIRAKACKKSVNVARAIRRYNESPKRKLKKEATVE